MLTNNGNERKPIFTRIEQLKAQWITNVYQESGKSKTSARAMHYFCLGRTDYPQFNGRSEKVRHRQYADPKSDAKDVARDDYNHICNWISLAKRMRLIDWDALPDERVTEYGELIHVPCNSDFSYGYSFALNDLDSPIAEFQDYIEKKEFDEWHSDVERDQLFHLEVWIEKNTMNAELEPICATYGAVLVSHSGHASWGSAWKLCRRAANDHRPCLIFYLSDLDASGFMMAHELAEKVAEINAEFFDGRLDIRIKRIGLTPEQVVRYKIPLIDRSPKEKSNGELYRAYVEPYGIKFLEKAELDALERFYPDGIEGLVRNSLRRYYDPTLSRRCREATFGFIRAMPETPRLPENVIELRERLRIPLDELIKAEREIEVPVGGFWEPDIEPLTEDPALESWLLSTQDGVYPHPDDVDFAKED